MNQSQSPVLPLSHFAESALARWNGQLKLNLDREKSRCVVECDRAKIVELCEWIFSQCGYSFATLIVEDTPGAWVFRHVFYGDAKAGLIQVVSVVSKAENSAPSVSGSVHATDWHERETEDLFGIAFEGHPRLGDFVLHEEWPEGVNPMRAGFDAATPYQRREIEPDWRPQGIVRAPGVFMMPIGPVYSDTAEAAHFLLETVGEDVIRTIPRFFYKYRGVEKIAEGLSLERVLLLAERFSGTSAFAHSLAFCQAAEEISGAEIPMRAKALRVVFAELERFRHHIAAIGLICQSTALTVAASQASILEEEALRLTGAVADHRYLFGINTPGGLSRDFSDQACRALSETVDALLARLCELKNMLRFSSSFLDRLEDVGMISQELAFTYGLVGPVARASGISRDLRKVLPYAGYKGIPFEAPCEMEGDGYARLRVLFGEAEQSATIIRRISSALPEGDVRARMNYKAGSALGWTEAPRGAAFHWLKIGEDGCVARFRLTTPSFSNWHGFHLAAEDYAFQDFPIIMATFGLSNAESDR